MKAKLFPILLLASAVMAGADTFSLSINQHEAKNVFQTSTPVSDRISSFGLFYGKDSGGLSLMSEAHYSLFHQNTALSFGDVSFGFDYIKPASTKSAFYLAARGSGNLYRESYRAFSSLAFDLAGAFKTYLAPTSILNLQWRGDYWSFRDPLFDFMSQVLSLSLDKFFQSRTTVKVEAGWKVKYFLHPYLSTPPEPLALLSSGAGGSMGDGGTRYQGGSGFVPRYNPAGGGAGIGNASLGLLLAQGLGERVGLSLSGLKQWNLSGENPFLSIEEFYFVQNPSSDDFSWEGWTASAVVSAALPGDFELKIGYTYADKEYPGVEVISAEGEPTGFIRNDRRELLEGRLEKSFPRLTLFLAYSRVVSRSNDPLFEWRSPFLQGGIEWSFTVGR